MHVGPQLLAVARGAEIDLPADRTDRFVEEAVEHRVVGLVRAAMDEGRLTAERPAALRTAVAAELLRNGARWRSVEPSALAAVEALATAGCPVMVMKGWWSMYQLHDHPDDRVTSDIDLLLEPAWHQRRPEVVRALAQPDIAPTARGADLQGWSFRFREIDVDLHRWSMTLPIPMDDRINRHIWEWHTRPGHPRWAGARTPSVELALAQAVTNYGKDRYMQLFQMDEVRRLMTRCDLDWDEFNRLTDLAGVAGLASAGLRVVCRALALPEPPGLRRRSLVFIPWTSPRVVLSGRRAPLGPAHVAALGGMTYGSWGRMLQTVGRRIAPRSSQLPIYLEHHGLPATGGYLRGLAALSGRRLLALARSLPRERPPRPGVDLGAR